MISKIIKLVNNTKAVFKFDDTPKPGSDALVTSGATATAIDTAKSDIIGGASDDYNTLGKIENVISNLSDAGAVVKTTWSELKDLRDSGGLLPGTLYRITDYENPSIVNFDGLTTHQFDIILLALSENELAEEGWAAMHENIYDVIWGGVVTKKAFINITSDEVYYVEVDDTTKGIGLVDLGAELGLSLDEFVTIDESTKTVTIASDYDTLDNLPNIWKSNVPYNYFQDSDLSSWKLWYCLDNDKFDLSETSTDKGIIYRIEDSTGKICKLKWKELKTLRDSAALVAGSKYRIVDYITTTVQENTRSAGHQFDIVLPALTESVLAEEGWATMHESDVYDVTFTDGVIKKCYLYRFSESECNIVDAQTLLGLYGVGYGNIGVGEDLEIDDINKTAICNIYESNELLEENLTYNYFQNSNLSAWKVWYCLDNDTSRFAWASDVEQIVDLDSGLSHGAPLKRCPSYDGVLSGDYHDPSYYYAWGTDADLEDDDTTDFIYSKNEHVLPGELVWSGDTQGTEICRKGSIHGTGVIYRLIDEFNNDCPYDFKNINFKRPLTNGYYDENAEDVWCYTLTLFDTSDYIYKDASIVGNTLRDDSYIFEGVFGNKIMPVESGNEIEETGRTTQFILNNNVITSIGEDEGFYGLNGTIFGIGCKDNTVCVSKFVVFGDSCRRNILKGNNDNCSFGTECYDNILGTGSSYVRFGDNCTSNTLGNQCIGNTIQEGCRRISLGDSCKKNYFSHGCDLITLGKFCENNLFEMYAQKINFNEYCSYNIIGYIGFNITFSKKYCSLIQTGIYNRNVTITTNQTTSSSAYLKNIILGSNIEGTITHPTVGDTFQTTYLPTGSTTVNV